MDGASNNYANPKILFAARYSAYFDSAPNLDIKKRKIKT